MEVHRCKLIFLVIFTIVISHSDLVASTCPRTNCFPPPQDACIKPKYKIVKGELCPDCYYIVKCPIEPVLCLDCCGPPPCCSDCGIGLVPEVA